MLSKCSQFLQQSASGRNVIILLFVAIASMWLMAAVITPAFQAVTNDLRPFDLNLGITAEIMYRDLPAYTERSRTLYVWFAIVDYIYPAAVAAFFSLLWALILNKARTPFFDRLRRGGVLIFPFLYALVDWMENAGFLFVIFRYPAEYPIIANLAGALKQIKPFVLLTVIILTVLLAVTAVWQAQRRSH